MKYLLLIIVLISCAGEAYSGGMIFYKYAEGNGYSVLVTSVDEVTLGSSTDDVIVKEMTGASFGLENVPLEYYTVNVTNNLVFFGENVVQYEIIPITEDRFSHIIWVDSKRNLIKTEVYDLTGKLMLAFSNIDFNDRKNRFRISLDPEKEDSHPFSEDMNQQYDIEDKQEDEELSINGFKHIFTRTIHNNIKHMTFSDGLNMFSVFINPKPENSDTVYKITYGNYLMSKVVSGVEYIITGTIPYSFMAKVIENISSFGYEENDFETEISAFEVFGIRQYGGNP